MCVWIAWLNKTCINTQTTILMKTINSDNNNINTTNFQKHWIKNHQASPSIYYQQFPKILSDSHPQISHTKNWPYILSKLISVLQSSRNRNYYYLATHSIRLWIAMLLLSFSKSCRQTDTPIMCFDALPKINKCTKISVQHINCFKWNAD